MLTKKIIAIIIYCGLAYSGCFKKKYLNNKITEVNSKTNPLGYGNHGLDLLKDGKISSISHVKYLH